MKAEIIDSIVDLHGPEGSIFALRDYASDLQIAILEIKNTQLHTYKDSYRSLERAIRVLSEKINEIDRDIVYIKDHY